MIRDQTEPMALLLSFCDHKIVRFLSRGPEFECHDVLKPRTFLLEGIKGTLPSWNFVSGLLVFCWGYEQIALVQNVSIFTGISFSGASLPGIVK